MLTSVYSSEIYGFLIIIAISHVKDIWAILRIISNATGIGNAIIVEFLFILFSYKNLMAHWKH